MFETTRLKDFLTRLLVRISLLGRYFIPKTVSGMIRFAINEKRLLELDYDGYYRIVEPHVYGQKFEKDGMMTYQVRGQSSSGVLGWKRMKVEKITNMKVLDERFPGRRPATDRHSSWDVIYLIVD